MRRIYYHFIIDSRKYGDISWYGAFRIDEGMIASFNLAPIMKYDGNLGNSTGRCVSSRGFNIYNGIHSLKLRIQDSP